MNLQQIMRTGITASAIAHLSVLALVLFFTEVHPFGSVTAEPIAVDLVSPDEVVKAPEKVEPPPAPKQKPSDALDLSTKPAASNSPAPAAPQQPASAAPPPPAAQPQKQAAVSPPQPNRQPPAAQPQSQPPGPPTATLPAASPATSPLPAIIPAAPDLSLKYHVLLGLPQEKPDDGIDAMASTKADVASNLVAEFRRHLRTCSTLPKSIAPSDAIKLKLRVFMTPEGRLATDPVLLEASASAKGPALMQSAIGALQACQPYAMLPADRYDEWKVLDLGFTPQDFTGG
jgi:outer membrane biosynthesis protein TonB